VQLIARTTVTSTTAMKLASKIKLKVLNLIWIDWRKLNKRTSFFWTKLKSTKG
jgi:hypothetical protein